jgi:sigma-54 dependent transcriptional regulator, acetoin dehydrogenase operon transcriptional activator AcoR
MTKENQIRRAWEGFVENGTVAIGMRGIIAESWQRSQDHGITVERKGAPLALEPELLQRYSAHSTLVEAARPALSQARLFLAEANSIIILTDPSGFILETAGAGRHQTWFFKSKIMVPGYPEFPWTKMRASD